MASAAIIAVCIYFSLWWLNKATLHGSSVEVPNLKLMQLDQAMVQLDSLGLTYEVIDSTHYVSQVPEGSIIETYPR